MRISFSFVALAALVLVCGGTGGSAKKLDPAQDLVPGGVPLIYNCTAEGRKGPVYTITLDDGIRSTEYHNNVMQSFQKHNRKPFFFTNGDNYDCLLKYRETLRTEQQTGSAWHGSHGWAHANSTNITLAQFKREVRLVELAYAKMGLDLPRLFRFPYGEHNDDHLRVLKKMGYHAAVQWSVDSNDWQTWPIEQKKAEMRKLFNGAHAHRNELFLNHEVQDDTALHKLEEWEMKQMAKHGKKYVDLPNCLGIHRSQVYRKPTQHELDIVFSWSGTSCEAFAASYDKCVKEKHFKHC